MGGDERRFEELLARYPLLRACAPHIRAAYETMRDCYRNGGKVLLCGNGGSCADCDHILGELMKGFCLPRPLDAPTAAKLERSAGERGRALAAALQRGLPAVNLCSNQALITAVANDTSPELIFAQQVAVYGRPGDVLLGISPLGHAVNVNNALVVARALELSTIGLGAVPGGEMPEHCDVAVLVPEDRVFTAQELHLPIYHTLCLMLEEHFFGA